MSKETEIQLDRFQAEAFARGLFALAKADGVHERELALVASFWADTGGSAAALSEQRRAPVADLEGKPPVEMVWKRPGLLRQVFQESPEGVFAA